MIKRLLNIVLVLVILLQSFSSATMIGNAETIQKNVSLTKSSQTEYVFKIVKQPNSVAVANGSNASVSVEVKGKGLKYKWYYKDAKAEKFVLSTACKNNTYSVAMSNSRDKREVYCIITDKFGKKLKTNTVTLRKSVSLKASKTNKKLTYISGEMAVLSAKTNLKGELNYQWYFADKGAKKFEKAAAKTKDYQITMNTARSGRKVYCVVIDENGNRVKTQTATLNTIKKLKITKQPTDAIVREGKNATISFKVSGENGLKYEWYIKNVTDKRFAKSSVKLNKYSTISNNSSDGRKIYCVVTDKYGQKVTTETVKIIMSDVATVSRFKKTINVMAGKTAIVTAKTNLKGNLKYQWYIADRGSNKFIKASAKNAKYKLVMNNANDGRKIYCKVTDNKGNTVKTQIIVLNTVKKLKIISQPKDVMIGEGKNVNISVKVSGEKELKYQWYIKNIGEKKYGKSSEKTNCYSTVSRKSSNRRKVYCVITDKYGQKVTTKTVTIKMSDVIKISKKSKTINVVSGRNVIVTAKTNLKGNLKYQWYYANRGSNVFKKADKKTATYKTVMNSERDGRKIYCVITDGKGKKFTTQTAILNNVKKLKITQQPKNVVASKGKTATVSFKVVGEKNLTYTWYIKNKNDKNFGKSSVKDSYYKAVASKSADGRKVYCVITDRYGQKVTTKTVTIRMAEVLKVSKTTKEIMVRDSETAIVKAVVSGKGKLKYQWYYANQNSNKFYKASVTTSTYKTVVNESRDGMKVYCVVTDSRGKQYKTQIAIFNNIKQLEITNQPEDVTIPNGDKVTVSFKVSGENQLKYQWYVKDKNSSTFKKTSCISSEYSVIMTDAVNGRKMYCVVTDNHGQMVKTDIISFKKIKRLVVTLQPKGDLVMNGEVITLNTAATGEGKLSYRWMYADAGNKVFTKTAITSPTYEVEMNSNRNGRRMYCLISDAYGQEVTTNIVTLKSYKKLVITEQPKNITMMSGKNATAKFGISGEEDLNYTWYIKNVEDDKFYKSSDTDSEYSIKITNENSGRQAYCVVTDNHGQKVTTNTITFKKNPNALHILIIGNSHSLDTFWFLRSAYMDQNPNSDICVAILYSSSGSIAGHSRVIKNNEATNRYYLNNNGKWNCTYDVSHKEVLEDQEWDIILMQPGKADITTKTVNKVSRYEVIDYVNQHVKNPHKFVWHVTWPCPNDETFFSPDYIRQPPAGYKDRLERLYDFNPINQYKEKVEKTQNVVLKENFYSSYVYTGAAVMHALYEQNVSQLELYRDYTHLSDYGRLLASYAFYAQLFEKPIQEVGINVISQNSRFYLFEHLGDIKLTQRQKNIIVKAANFALNDKTYIPEDK